MLLPSSDSFLFDQITNSSSFAVVNIIINPCEVECEEKWVIEVNNCCYTILHSIISHACLSMLQLKIVLELPTSCCIQLSVPFHLLQNLIDVVILPS